MEYDTGAKNFAIMKVINYKDSSFEKIQEHVDYILNKDKSPEQYQKGWYVDCKQALRGLEQLYKRYHPKGTRNFKHWIVSFGVPFLDAEKGFEVSKEIAGYYAKEYPVILGLHTNIPKRIHCHFLQNTVDIRSGKKFSQSLDDFKQFRVFVNKILEEYKLPLLRGVSVDRPFIKEQNADVNNDFYTDYSEENSFTPYYYSEPQYIIPKQCVVNNVSLVQCDFDIPKSLKIFGQGVNQFYKYGRGYDNE